MNRTAVKVLIGMTGLDGPMPATCVPLDGSGPAEGYMTHDLAELFGEDREMMFWAEWNGISFDLVEPMTPEEIDVAQDAEMDVPF